jgi:DNA invertase Pin-like site-specific DNA recombinase
MTSAPKRMDGYVRVSRRMGREGPAYISPSVQREAIEKWAEYRDVEIVAWHEDEDESGGTQNRPGLREAMRRVEAGETEGIACWRLNRFARNVAGALEDVKRIQAAGGHLAFIQEDIDPTGPFGSFILTVLLAVATLERDNITASWRIAQERAIARGAKVSKPNVGYLKMGDSVLTPDPATAPHVIEAFNLSAASQDVSSATRYLIEHLPDYAWTTATTRRTLARRVYLGESSAGKLGAQFVNANAHPPLVSRAVWEAAQHDPRPYGQRTPSTAFPLRGLARCATCGAAMVGAGGAAKPMYRCSALQTLYKGERCKGGASIKADRLEEYVRSSLAPILDGFSVEASDGNPDTLKLTEDAMREADAELNAFAGDLTLRRALGSRYHEHLDSRVEARDAARREYRELAKDQQVRERVSAADILEESDPHVFRELLSGILASITVAPGRGSVEERVRLLPIDDNLLAGPAPAADS